jgi:hypothetical protein
MADVFTVLAQDHQEVKAMLAELERGPTKATGATEDQLALRKKMTEQLIIEESRHEALQEMYFWPAVHQVVQRQLDQLPGGALDRPQDDALPVHSMDVLARPFLSAHAGCCAAADVGARGARVRAIARIVGSRRWQASVPASGNRPA